MPHDKPHTRRDAFNQAMPRAAAPCTCRAPTPSAATLHAKRPPTTLPMWPPYAPPPPLPHARTHPPASHVIQPTTGIAPSRTLPATCSASPSPTNAANATTTLPTLPNAQRAEARSTSRRLTPVRECSPLPGSLAAAASCPGDSYSGHS